MQKQPVAKSKTVLARGLKLHYLDWGGLKKHPLLLLHGLQDCGASWKFFVPWITESYRVLALDHRGHGDSPWASDGSYGLDDYVEELTEVIDALDLHNLTLIGHSAGAKNAFIYASKHSSRLRRLVIVDMDPDALNHGSASMFQRYRAEPDIWENLDAVVERLRLREPRTSEKILRHHAIALTNERPDGSMVWKRDKALVMGYERPDAWEMLGKIDCPTLLIRGIDSPLLSHDVAIRMKGKIPNCELVELDDSGHWCYDENPLGFARVVLQFLG
ncbi:alpha/beta hydrolase [Dehalococcoidia bacterium]|nr:alpha/beta hydrolase [Dehalococcoidia bacterium]